MNRLAVLQREAAKLKLPSHYAATARRAFSDSLEVQVAYLKDGKKYFGSCCFMGSDSDEQFIRDLDQLQPLVELVKNAVAEGKAA